MTESINQQSTTASASYKPTPDKKVGFEERQQQYEEKMKLFAKKPSRANHGREVSLISNYHQL
jgi:hypothetical protein